MRKVLMSAAMIALTSLSVPAHAQQDHGGHAAATRTPANAAPSTAAYRKANDAMHKAMAIQYTGNADVDFVRGMIPHHQSAIDLARIALTHGKDPQVKKLAQEIIAAQQTEIAEMQDWLKKNAK